MGQEALSASINEVLDEDTRRYIQQLLNNPARLSADCITPVINLLTRIMFYEGRQRQRGNETLFTALGTPDDPDPYSNLKKLPCYKEAIHRHFGDLAECTLAVRYLVENSDQSKVALYNALIAEFNGQINTIKIERSRQAIHALYKRIHLLIYENKALTNPDFNTPSGLCVDARTPLVTQVGIIDLIASEPDEADEYTECITPIPSYKAYLQEYLNARNASDQFDFFIQHAKPEAINRYNAIVDEYNADFLRIATGKKSGIAKEYLDRMTRVIRGEYESDSENSKAEIL